MCSVCVCLLVSLLEWILKLFSVFLQKHSVKFKSKTFLRCDDFLLLKMVLVNLGVVITGRVQNAHGQRMDLWHEAAENTPQRAMYPQRHPQWPSQSEGVADRRSSQRQSERGKWRHRPIRQTLAFVHRSSRPGQQVDQEPGKWFHLSHLSVLCGLCSVSWNYFFQNRLYLIGCGFNLFGYCPSLPLMRPTRSLGPSRRSYGWKKYCW